MDKVARIELTELISPEPQKKFLLDYKDHLANIKGYSLFEFERLNYGRSIEEIKKEMDFFKKNI